MSTKQVDQTRIALMPGVNVGQDIGFIRKAVDLDDRSLTVNGKGPFPIVCVEQKLGGRPALLSSRTKELMSRQENVICVHDVSSLEPALPHQDPTIAIVYGTEQGARRPIPRT